MRRLFGLVSVLLALFVACQFPGCRGILVANPGSARPGEMVHLHQDRGNFQSYDSLRVTIGNLPTYARVGSNTDVDVMVPIAPPGTVAVRLQNGMTVTATASLLLLPTGSQRVVMKTEGNHVSLLRVEPCVDAITGDVPTLHTRLSFDVIDTGGHVLHTGSIPHPLKTESEVFVRSGGAATIERRPPSSPAIFWIRIPNQPEAWRMLVYEAAAGLDLADSTDRDNRVFLDSLLVKNQ